MLKVVYDANVVVSGLLNEESIPVLLLGFERVKNRLKRKALLVKIYR